MIPHLMAVALVAFAPWSHGGASVASTAPQDTAATVVVQNDRSVPVTLFVERENGDLRIGTVPPVETATFTLPMWLAAEHTRVRLFLHPEGELDLASQEFELKPGARLGVMVAERGAMPAEHRVTAELTPAERNETTITVDNGRKEDVVIYVEHGPFDLRLGTVPAGSERTLAIPSWLAIEHEYVEVFAHVVHGHDLTTERVTLRPRAHLSLHIPADRSAGR